MSNEQPQGKNGSGSTQGQGLPVQQIIQMGQQASQLLNHPIYNVAHQMVVNDLINQWSTTSPKESQRRESLYHEVQAMGRIANQLGAVVGRAEELLEQQRMQNQNADRDYYDRQGFGLGPDYEPNGAGFSDAGTI